jgi:hypothetical protein
MQCSSGYNCTEDWSSRSPLDMREEQRVRSNVEISDEQRNMFVGLATAAKSTCCPKFKRNINLIVTFIIWVLVAM